MIIKPQEVVIVCQIGAHITDQVHYGALRATVEMAKQLKALGRAVLLVGLGVRGDGRVDGVEYIALGDEQELKRFVRSLQQVKYLIGISRGDILLMAHADNYLVYHHGPHPPQGIDVQTMRLAHVPIVCVSESSRREQISFGLRESEIFVVRNGYDKTLFYRQDIDRRSDHSLIFAGSIVPYKGVDIALNAFRLLKEDFPNATFDVCGKQHEWSAEEAGSMPSHWVDSMGHLNWGVIQKELPGVKYHGEMSQSAVAAIFNCCSLLVMCSRVAEPCPLVVLEAQACGCIPVVPNSGGWPEIVAKEISWYLYQAPPSEQVLCRKIAAIWDDKKPSDEQRAIAQFWAERFSWDAAGNEFNAIMETLVHVDHNLMFMYRLSAWWQAFRSMIKARTLMRWWQFMKWSQPVRHSLGLRRL